MKDFYDVYNSTLTEKEELPTLFCDMDMVLVDFLKGGQEVGQSFVKMDNAKRWATIHKNKTFWENLDWILVQRDYGVSLINMVHIYYLHIQQKIVTVCW